MLFRGINKIIQKPWCLLQSWVLKWYCSISLDVGLYYFCEVTYLTMIDNHATSCAHNFNDSNITSINILQALSEN